MCFFYCQELKPADWLLAPGIGTAICLFGEKYSDRIGSSKFVEFVEKKKIYRISPANATVVCDVHNFPFKRETQKQRSIYL